jgi:hypothetical protein
MESVTATGQEEAKVPVVLGGSLAPLGWSMGFVEAPHNAVRDRLIEWRHSLGAQVDIAEKLPAWPSCVEALAPLEAPWTTGLLVAHGSAWTAYLNNDINGGDPWPPTSYVANQLGVLWVIATHQPMTAVGHASSQFWLGGREGEPPLHYIRTVAAHAEDGRWSWDTGGSPLPFERTDAYAARLVRHRFTRALLVEYLNALGIAVDDDRSYGDATLVRQHVTWTTRQQTLQQAQRSWNFAEAHHKP